MSAKMREALIAYMAAGFGNSTDYEKQAYARRMAMEALAEQPAQHAVVSHPAQGDAVDYARRLAVALHRNHYTDEAPNWEPFDDLYGLLSQIDNMVCGMTRTAPPATTRTVGAATVPDGWRIVPIRATDEMTKAVRYDEDAFGAKSAWPSDIWRDMVRAAPEPRP